MCKITTAINLFSIKQLKSCAFFPPGLFPHFSVSPQGIVSTQDLTSTQIWPLQYKTKRASQTRSPYAYSTHQCPHRILNTWTNLDAKTRWPHKSDLIAQRKLDAHTKLNISTQNSIWTKRAGSPRLLAGSSNSSFVLFLCWFTFWFPWFSPRFSCGFSCWFTSRAFSRYFLARVVHLLHGIVGSGVGLSAPWFTSLLLWLTSVLAYLIYVLALLVTPQMQLANL